MVITTEGFLKIAIGSWSTWNLNQNPLNSAQSLDRLSYQAMSFTRTSVELFPGCNRIVKTQL